MAVTRKKQGSQSSVSESVEFKVTILCVDDEQAILDALTRFFGSLGWRTVCATSGAMGFEVLEEAERNGLDINLVISDMRMPEMSGAEFLTCVRQRYPGIVRVLLTGFSDMDALTAAINQAKIFNYVAKPWDEDLLQQLVESALSFQGVEREKERLLRLTERQNQKLQEMNQQLEDRVEERTEKLNVALSKLKESYGRLQDSYKDTLSLLSHIIDWQESRLGVDCAVVAEMVAAVAKELQLEPYRCRRLYDACLLKDIGMLALPEGVRKKSPANMSEAEMTMYRKHPIHSEAALASVPSLVPIAELVRHHHEHLDGSGYPDRQLGDQLSLEVRVLNLVTDYHELAQGFVDKTVQGYLEAMEYVHKRAGQKYDANVVRALQCVVDRGKSSSISQLKKEVRELLPGMRLARSIVSDSGVRLLAKETELSGRHIERLKRFETDAGSQLDVRIYELEL